MKIRSIGLRHKIEGDLICIIRLFRRLNRFGRLESLWTKLIQNESQSEAFFRKWVIGQVIVFFLPFFVGFMR